jgi:hypothetical protein
MIEQRQRTVREQRRARIDAEEEFNRANYEQL